MTQLTLRTLAVLLDNHAVLESARFEGVLDPTLPGGDREDALLARDRTWTAVDKLILNQPLTDPELQAAQEALDWYQKIPEAQELPIGPAQDLLKAWNLPPDAAGTVAIDDFLFDIFDRYVSEEEIEHADSPSTVRDRSNGSRKISTALAAADVDIRVSAAYEQARFGFHQLALELGDDDTKAALGALGEIEENIAEMPQALEARRG